MTNRDATRPFAVITGASRGIGAEYARALASRGYDLLLVARDRARLDRLAEDLTTQHQVHADIALLDLAEPEAAHRLYTAAREFRPAVDLLINNAGFGSVGEFVAMPMARIQAMLRLHVNTIVESSRLFLPGMIERRSGAMINVASTAGFMPIAGMTEYAATKTFLIAFSEALAEEVRPYAVRVQVCCPGATLTDFHHTAGSHPKGPFKAQTAEEVVAASLNALGSGRTVVTTHWSGTLTDWLGRWVPRGVLARGAAWWMRRSKQR
ncbi:MAG: SDR family oxidoreductase [Nitrospirota bacterium]|nr:SDR family oxidoreductase [Nitrospirota bacterium]MDE3241167.1 SDR family oxidoreductase [Nitrospirota bacterium]